MSECPLAEVLSLALWHLPCDFSYQLSCMKSDGTMSLKNNWCKIITLTIHHGLILSNLLLLFFSSSLKLRKSVKRGSSKNRSRRMRDGNVISNFFIWSETIDVSVWN